MGDNIYTEIKAERAYQDNRWGKNFDDNNSIYNWAAFITNYATNGLTGNPLHATRVAFRKNMVKVAALAVAAIESIDRTEAAQQKEAA